MRPGTSGQWLDHPQITQITQILKANRVSSGLTFLLFIANGLCMNLCNLRNLWIDSGCASRASNKTLLFAVGCLAYTARVS